MTLQEALSTNVVLDGGLGSELERNGCDLSDRLWSARVLLEQPEMIAKVHADYLSAGADCIIAASYQVSSLGFRRAGLGADQATKALTQAIEIARQVRDEFEQEQGRRALVAGSVGPYGAILADGSEFRGDYSLSLEELVTFHAQRMAVIANAGPDLLACETIPSLLEARALLESLHRVPSAKAWFTFTCQDHRRVAHGETLAECVGLLESDPQVVAIGVNCTAPRWIAELVRTLRTQTRKPIVIYPNSGRQWDARKRCWIGTSDLRPAEMTAEWRAAGAQWIGGCCGTTPEDIREIRAALKAA